MRAVVAAGTDIGRVREGNEDSYLVHDPLFAVADGMGGHRGGEVASHLALETVDGMFGRSEGALPDQVREANRAVFERSLRDRAVAGMGTTLTAALLDDGRIRVVHVGDSRAYLFRDGTLDLLTEDHTLVHRMVLEGELTPEEAEVHPHRSILTRALGVDPDVEVDQLDIEVHPGDRLLLCTDGLTGMISEATIAEILTTEPDPDAAVARLIAEANGAGGVDNITAILLDIQEGDPDLPTGTATATLAPGRGTGSPQRTGRPRSGDGDGMASGAGPAPAPRRPRSSARTAIVIGVPVAVVVLVLIGGRMYLDNQWYVGESNDHVAVYRGIPASVAGFHLHHVVVETSIPAAAAESLALYRRLPEGITADDREEADAIVEQIRLDVASVQAQATP